MHCTKEILCSSKRELDVFIRIGNGQRITDIANELGVSIKTASTFLTRAKIKMGLDSVPANC